MIKIEEMKLPDGRLAVKRYSDRGVYIRKVGTDEEYVEAVDVLPFDYEETDRKIERLKTEEEIRAEMEAAALKAQEETEE